MMAITLAATLSAGTLFVLFTDEPSPYTVIACARREELHRSLPCFARLAQSRRIVLRLGPKCTDSLEVIASFNVAHLQQKHIAAGAAI
jgi:hypothetical protein